MRPVEEGEVPVGIALENELAGTPRANTVSMGDMPKGAGSEHEVFRRARRVVDPGVGTDAEAIGRTVAEAPDVSGGVGGDVTTDGVQGPWLQNVRHMVWERASGGMLGRYGHKHGGGVGEGGGDEGLRK